MKTIKINSDTSIDLAKLIDSRLLIQANSGSGKSWAIRRILEQSHGKVQQIVIDLEGEFGTLREKYEYILAGKGGDTPATPQSAALLARKLLELNVSAIIDLYELPHQDRKRFVRLFLESMINAPKELWHPVMVIIDEAHVFVPEKGESEAASAVIDLATRGRKRGFCAVLATQRISKLHKDAAAECNNKLIGRSSQDIDMKRASDELGFNSRDQQLSLRSLQPGEFYAFGPAISEVVIKLKIGDITTSHPKAGSRTLTAVVPPTENIKKILGKLADLPQEAIKEAQTISELKKEIAMLRRAKTPQKQGITLQTQQKIIEKSINDATLIRDREWKTGLSQWLKCAPDKYIPIKKVNVIPQKNVFIGARPNIENMVSEDDMLLTNPEKRILNAIAWMESIGIQAPKQPAVAFLAGYSFGGGAFNNPRGALRTKGFVEYQNDGISLTDEGRKFAEVPTETLTIDELHKKVLSILPTPEKKILEIVLAVYPESITNEILAEQSGYAAGGGAFNNPRGRLRTLGLIEYSNGSVRAKPLLFLEN